MASVNKVIIIGRLGQDPEIRQFNNGDKIANLSVATSNKWTDKATGEPKEQTEWHRVVLLGKVADVAEQYLQKGSQIYVEGSLHTRKWQDNNGIDRYSTEIKCYTMQMLGGGQQQQNGGYPSQQGYPQPQGGYHNQPQQNYQPQGGYQPQTQGYQPMGQPQGYPQQPSPQGYPQPPMQGMGNSSYQPMTSHAPVPPHTPTATDDDMPF